MFLIIYCNFINGLYTFDMWSITGLLPVQSISPVQSQKGYFKTFVVKLDALFLAKLSGAYAFCTCNIPSQLFTILS